MKRIILVLALAATLAACSRSEPEAVPEANDAVERPAPPVTAAPSPVAPPTTEPSVNMTAPVPPPPEEIGADEQMMDDASATGMTARAERDQEEATETPPLNIEQP